jgi:hypothetical protein
MSLLVLVFLFSCDKSGFFVICSDCSKTEPVTAVIEIKVDNTALLEGVRTIISIYSGNLEDNILIIRYVATGPDLTYNGTVNKKYTITATYNIDNKEVIAVGTVYPKVKHETEQCEAPCYFMYDKKVNLSLKYTP